MRFTGNMQVLGLSLGSFIEGGVHREYVGFRVLFGFLGGGGGLIGNIQALGLGA